MLKPISVFMPTAPPRSRCSSPCSITCAMRVWATYPKNYFLQREIAEDARMARPCPEDMEIVLASATTVNAQARSAL